MKKMTVARFAKLATGKWSAFSLTSAGTLRCKWYNGQLRDIGKVMRPEGTWVQQIRVADEFYEDNKKEIRAHVKNILSERKEVA